jgi:hypothetical protein
MSKEVLAAISRTYELATYSTPELRSLFNDWLTEIEQLMIDFINERRQADPAKIADHFHLQRGSVIFILSKLATEGKIDMQASGSEQRNSKIHLLRKA